MVGVRKKMLIKYRKKKSSRGHMALFQFQGEVYVNPEATKESES